MDRYWLLTWTTYGTWLPGDRRGFVSNVRGTDGHGERHNLPATETDADLSGLRRFATGELRTDPVWLSPEQAAAVIGQSLETAQCRGWQLFAAAVMANHVRLVVGVTGDPNPEALLRDFKSYASRALNRRWPRTGAVPWWTTSGSRRKLPNQLAVESAITYVRQQHCPLVVYVAGETANQPTDQPGANAPGSPNV